MEVPKRKKETWFTLVLSLIHSFSRFQLRGGLSIGLCVYVLFFLLVILLGFQLDHTLKKKNNDLGLIGTSNSETVILWCQILISFSIFLFASRKWKDSKFYHKDHNREWEKNEFLFPVLVLRGLSVKEEDIFPLLVLQEQKNDHSVYFVTSF